VAEQRESAAAAAAAAKEDESSAAAAAVGDSIDPTLTSLFRTLYEKLQEEAYVAADVYALVYGDAEDAASGALLEASGEVDAREYWSRQPADAQKYSTLCDFPTDPDWAMTGPLTDDFAGMAVW
jgi:hypothetical protein